MKAILIATALLTLCINATAQEPVPRQECLKYAFFAAANLKEMLKTPIPTDPDVKRPVAVRDGEFGGMVLPESKLSAEVLARAGSEVTPVGQLWLHKLTPMSGESAVPASKLRTVHVNSSDEEADVPCLALGVRKGSDGSLQLLIYGKEKEPIVKVPMKAIAGSAAQENPIEISAERKDEGGLVTLRLVGKYQASFMVTEPEQ
jgi:hypothetical protein